MADNGWTEQAFDGFVGQWTEGTIDGRRSPLLRRPDEVGLHYEEVTFPSMDGVALEGWFIPAESNRLIIHNHFSPGNRYGLPGHLPEFGRFGGFEVSFLPEYRALHDAGYNILTYDHRNHGLSGYGNGGLVGVGHFEYRDVVGSLRYAASRPDTQGMKKAMLSVCMGANSTAVAWTKRPEAFAEILALVLLQPLDGRSIGEQFAKAIGFEGGYDRLDMAVHQKTGFRLQEQSPLEYARGITVPTLVAQVHDDVMTTPEAVQAIYDAIPAEDKDLHWIHGTDRRFDGYNYFSEHPEVAVAWFDKHLN